MKRSNLPALILMCIAFGPYPAIAQHADLESEQDIVDGVSAELALVRNATARYRDIRVAESDGFVRFDGAFSTTERTNIDNVNRSAAMNSTKTRSGQTRTSSSRARACGRATRRATTAVAMNLLT